MHVRGPRRCAPVSAPLDRLRGLAPRASAAPAPVCARFRLPERDGAGAIIYAATRVCVPLRACLVCVSLRASAYFGAPVRAIAHSRAPVRASARLRAPLRFCAHLRASAPVARSECISALLLLFRAPVFASARLCTVVCFSASCAPVRASARLHAFQHAPSRFCAPLRTLSARLCTSARRSIPVRASARPCAILHARARLRPRASARQRAHLRFCAPLRASARLCNCDLYVAPLGAPVQSRTPARASARLCASARSNAFMPASARFCAPVRVVALLRLRAIL